MWLSERGYTTTHRYYVNYTMEWYGGKRDHVQCCNNIYSLKAFVEYVLEERDYLTLKNIHDENNLPIYYEDGELTRTQGY